MKREIRAPSVGESVTEVRIGRWTKENGDAAKTGDVLLEIESDKATVEIVAEVSGALEIVKQTGETVKVGEVVGRIDEGVPGRVRVGASHTEQALSPAVRKVAADMGIDASKIEGTGKDRRVTKGDVLRAEVSSEKARRVPMSLLRQRIAERLVEAQNTAAILTTFNECDMTGVMALRGKHRDSFKAKYGVSLGFMSFFTRAVVLALREIPAVNAFIDGTDIVYHDYYDIGVAVGTERGLVVPVLRDVEKMSFGDIELAIAQLAEKARAGKLSIPDLNGATFSISNGGVYGSLMSTPILNPPQSGILGMHKIQERPVAINGEVVIRPMMYLALSYDHRIVDGREAVTFLVKIKEGVENPETLGFTL